MIKLSIVGEGEFQATLAQKAGRSFATNGPMLFLTVNGREPGAVLKKESLRRSRIRVRAEALSARPLERLEIVWNGRVVRTIRPSDRAERLLADFEHTVVESGWLAARCFEPAGSTIRFVHTSPVYVEGSPPNSQTRDAAAFFIAWIDREIEHFRRLEGFRRPSHRDEVLSFFSRARAVYARLR